MLVLSQPEKTFDSFKKLSKNYGFLKDLMDSAQGEAFSDHVINQILNIWKNQTIVQAKLVKTSKCASLLAQWIGFIVEYSLKKETVNSNKRKEPELEKKIKYQGHALQSLGKDLEKIKEKIISAKKNLQMNVANEEISEKFEVPAENPRPLGFVMHRGTASGGILEGSIRSQFPNFNDADLYRDANVKESTEIVFEGNNEALGCCSLKFFCF